MGTKKVLVINSKGGVGKSTLSSNLASYYASTGARTALCDFDRQMSAVRWLERRDASRPKIDSLTGWEYRQPDQHDWLIMDPPAGLARKELACLIGRADVLIIPVLPSPIDIHAAADFIRDLLIYGKIRATQKPLAVVANRARTNTVIYDQLKRFLQSLRLPFAASFRDSQNYIHASMQGIGVFEMAPNVVAHDIEQWWPLLHWIDEAVTKGRIPLAAPRPAQKPLKLKLKPKPKPRPPLLRAVN